MSQDSKRLPELRLLDAKIELSKRCETAIGGVAIVVILLVSLMGWSELNNHFMLVAVGALMGSSLVSFVDKVFDLARAWRAKRQIEAEIQALVADLKESE